MCEIIISLRPNFANLIENNIKNHEFRKKVPLKIPTKIWIYITHPVAELTYIAEVHKYVEYPKQIGSNGYGNIEFNNGLKSKYAYPIKRLYKFHNPIPLNELRTLYDFSAPQNFAYIEKYEKLREFVNIKKQSKRII